MADALVDLPSTRRQHAEAYAEFRRRFTYLEDGRAAERLEPVFDRVARRTAKRAAKRAAHAVPALGGLPG